MGLKLRPNPQVVRKFRKTCGLVYRFLGHDSPNCFGLEVCMHINADINMYI